MLFRSLRVLAYACYPTFIFIVISASIQLSNTWCETNSLSTPRWSTNDRDSPVGVDHHVVLRELQRAAWLEQERVDSVHVLHGWKENRDLAWNQGTSLKNREKTGGKIEIRDNGWNKMTPLTWFLRLHDNILCNLKKCAVWDCKKYYYAIHVLYMMNRGYFTILIFI